MDTRIYRATDYRRIQREGIGEREKEHDGWEALELFTTGNGEDIEAIPQDREVDIDSTTTVNRVWNGKEGGDGGRR
jgi:hypothetical protein